VKILVAGGTSRLGAPLVQRLVLDGHAVRVLSRDPRRGIHLAASVEMFVGDVRDEAALKAAVAGCETVVSAIHGFVGVGRPSPEAIDRDGNRILIRAASAAGANHFVLVSVHGAAPDHPMSLHRAKYAAEQALRESGIGFTIVRPTAFLETWLDVIGGPLAADGHALVFGPGRNPINLVSVRDVAELVALVACKSPSNEIVEIGGPENLGFVTLAERLIDAGGKLGRIKHIPLFALRALSVLARPFSPVFARQARAAVVMNTRDMTFDTSPRQRFPTVPITYLRDLLPARPSPLASARRTSPDEHA